MTGEPVHTTLEERMTPAYGFHLNTQIAKWPLRFVFSLSYSVTNEEHYKKDLCNQSSHNEKL